MKNEKHCLPSRAGRAASRQEWGLLPASPMFLQSGVQTLCASGQAERGEGKSPMVLKKPSHASQRRTGENLNLKLT